MATTTLKTRIQHKYNTPAVWAENASFVPLKGEICVFNNGSGAKPEMKIGDGTTTLASLPFLKAGGDISMSRNLTSGTKIATITIDGVATDLYCQTNTDTTYSAGTGLSLSGTTFSIASSVLTTSNYTSYVPTKTGTGASGTWGINITGSSKELKRSDDASYARLIYTNANQSSYHWGQIMYDSNNKPCYVYYSTSKDAEAPSIRVYGPDGGTSAIVLTTANYTSYVPTKTGSGASGTWGINITGSSTSCTGNAATATKWATARTISLSGDLSGSVSINGSANVTLTASVYNDSHTHTWLELAPGNVSLPTGVSMSNDTGPFNIRWISTAGLVAGQPNQYGFLMTMAVAKGSAEQHQLWFTQCDGDIYHRGTNGQNSDSPPSFKRLWHEGHSITSAVWNDYAEYRESDCVEFGRVLTENGDDTLSATTERLQHFAGISSDTWGFCQGETEKAKTPIAVAGRVLAYPYRDRNEYKPGDCVCAAPNGTVDIMTREEVEHYPDRIVGTVSCVPEYEEWGQGDRPAVKVDGRIWIKVK